MKFLIQSGNPLWSPPDELAAEYLSEAIEAIFPMDTEDAVMIWGDESVSLSYKYSRNSPQMFLRNRFFQMRADRSSVFYQARIIPNGIARKPCFSHRIRSLRNGI
ncbi:MAG: hypothetical protein B6245_21870 [Desulfobacteraceae bacterium 4572_88]|nr:MAG: hypothetical protein B6245_21870 [Desulfobacteraceae bacterium 4572_88]